MKYFGYLRQKEAHYAADRFLLDSVGIAEVLSETTENYGVMVYEITARGISTRALESLVRQDGWRKGSAIINKNERILELTEARSNALMREIRGRKP